MEILYRDEHLVAVNKPAGLLVHRSDLDRHETRFALQLVRDSLGRHVYPAHRLDRPTSGVLLFALSPGDAEVLGRAFAEGSVAKKYLAVVRGVPPDSGVIDYPLTVVEDRSVSSPGRGKEPRPAVTEFRRLASVEVPIALGRYPSARYSLVTATPRTGRRHQLRRHFAHLRHPIIGDTTYGESRHNRLFRDEFHCHRLLLHGAELSFRHPASGDWMTISAPLDGEFAAIVDRCDWREAVAP